MTSAEKKSAYECSVQGYLKQFHSKNYPNAMEAFVDSMSYFTKINLDPEGTTCNVHELLHVIKNEVAKYVAKQKIEQNEDVLNNEDNDKVIQMFLKDPTGFTGSFLENSEGLLPNVDYINNDDPEFESYVHSYKLSVKTLSSFLKTDAAKLVFDDFEKKNKTIDVLSSIEAKLPEGRNPIDKAFEKQKPGFWERLRNKTSKEYKDFKDTFEKYKDSNNEDFYGNDEELEKSAMAYLRHKFPGLKEGQLPTPQQIAKLSGAGKPRADFCLKVVESVRANRLMQPLIKNTIDACKNLDIQDAQKDNQQQVFQEQLAINSKEDNYVEEEKVAENNNELSKDNNIEIDNE